MLDSLVQRDDEQDRGRDTGGDVDEEHPAPRQVLDDDAPEKRPDQAGDSPDGAEDALHLRPLLQVVDVADDGQRRRLHRPGAQPLQGAKGDERADAAGETARHRANEEDSDACEQDRLAPVEIGELAVEGHRDGGRQQVSGEHPGVEMDAAQISDHRRHGSGDDGHLHRRHRETEQERDDGERAVRLHRGNYASDAASAPAVQRSRSFSCRPALHPGAVPRLAISRPRSPSRRPPSPDQPALPSCRRT